MNPNSLLFISLHWLVSGVALLVTAYLVRGFDVRSLTSSLVAAVVIGIANAIIWPILMVLTMPINVVTLGLFTFVVNGIVLRICAAVLYGFEIRSWGAAIFGSIILSVVSGMLHYILV
jgi:putative membrane protein